MATVTVDIHNRCGRRCKCAQNRQFLTGSVGIVTGDLEFRHCTHRATGGATISDATWSGAKLEILGYISQFRDTSSLTVFYHSTHGIKYGAIKKPLLIRIKRYYGKIYWYENLGSYANKRWRRLSYHESDNYPEGETYTSSSLLEEKLKALACRLHISHGIEIDSKANNHEINCRICQACATVTVLKESVSNIPGYIKYSYKGFINGCILVYNGKPLSFRKRSSETWLGYFIPIQIDKDNVEKVSIYYWDGDEECNSPLLLEIVGTNYISYWLENIGDQTGQQITYPVRTGLLYVRD